MRVMRKAGVYFGTCPHRHTGTADTGLKLLLNNNMNRGRRCDKHSGEMVDFFSRMLL